ncbi:hypothetical protein C5167_021834 [Papaver somniferum]|uniref:Uncharacterized protein n=1 Tax=Papaver somniferum TaxID=3469 RepID=A0A4Y7JH40_PAPSO|nr:hypothetical protein C5167_021834 [Papaver somniferum]
MYLCKKSPGVLLGSSTPRADSEAVSENNDDGADWDGCPCFTWIPLAPMFRLMPRKLLFLRSLHELLLYVLL